MTSEELENEIFISVIRDLLFFLFVNRARDPPVRPSIMFPVLDQVQAFSVSTYHTCQFLVFWDGSTTRIFFLCLP